MKRQRGRNRSGGGGGGGGSNSGGGGGGGGGKPSHNVNRAFDSNGPDNVKIRGHAQHVYEKYQQLARDASGAGDRVLAENYLQHAEHYFRVLRSIQPNRTVSEIMGRDALASGFDIDFEDENGESGEENEAQADNGGDGGQSSEERSERSEQRGDGGRQDQRGDNRQEPRQDYNRDRDNRDNRDNRPNNNNNNGNNNGQRDRYEPRPERAYGQGPRAESRSNNDPRNNEQRNNEQRNNEPRNEQRADNRSEPREPREPRENRGDRNERRYESRTEEPRAEAPARDPMPVVEPEAASPLLRDRDGGVSHAPAFLQTPTNAPPASEAAAPKPRAPRTRKPKVETAASSDEG